MNNFADLVDALVGIINLLVPAVFAITFLVIAWGVIKGWIINAGDETSLAEGRQLALAGVIALVVMSALWGILNLLYRSLF